MEYHEAANFLFDLRRFRPKPGTESTAEFLAYLGDPHDGLQCVQIAGSNGKGSTARMLESILREAGASVGLYTSPHFDDIRERIRVDGRKIPRNELAAFVEEGRTYVRERAADGESPTFFETMTAMALWYFGRQGVDVAVLEVGIGGRYDATSVVDPVASAVTSVTLEHTGIIGDTIEEIARDKAHVAPADAPLVTATTGEALDAVRDVAGEVVTVGGENADVTVAYEGRTNHVESGVQIAGADWAVEANLALLGAHQAENAGIAATLARQVRDASTDEIARGLRGAHWPGRFEVMGRSPLVVLDGAHNPGACARLADTLSTFDYERLHLVVGAMHDKDHRGIAAALPTPDAVLACEPDLDRAEDAAVLAAVFEDAGAGAVDTAPSVADALDRAMEGANSTDCVLVTGSLYAVAEARARWSRTTIPKRVRDRQDATDVLAGAAVVEDEVARDSDGAVHRVLKTRLQRRQAAVVEKELVAVGGECAVSGVRDGGEAIDVVLMGTRPQYERLVERLDRYAYGLPSIAADVRERLGLDGDGREGDATDDDEATAETDRPHYPWRDRTAIMGILNVTPDSFHDGGRYEAIPDAVSRAEAMVDAGADVVDVGGESTRPGAEPVSVEAEIDRVVPVIERLADLDALVSIDTRKAAVAEAALEAGADLVNDVSGLADPEMRFVVADHDAAVVVMHSLDAPVVPDRAVTYDDVVEDVIDELAPRVRLAEQAGVDPDRILVDPGIGFGKSPAENVELLSRVDELHALGCPVLVGHSHKSMFEHVDRGPGDRLAATVAATALAVDRGADVVRVHDVDENEAAVRVVEAANAARGGDR